METERADVVSLSTKLIPPRPRVAWVSRPLPLATLTEAETRLTLVSAPAGWGKSTLLTQWRAAAEGDTRVAWVALDPEDDDPVAFWGQVVGALRTLDPGVGEATLASLSSGTDLTGVALPLLLNELVGVSERWALVLDDYHRLSDPVLHDSVAFFVDHLPTSLRLLIASRVDPPLPLARLRADSDLTEVRAHDLRFAPTDAGLLLDASGESRLSGEDVHRLHERTEGWAAGLQLAALSLRRSEDPHAFVESFAGDDRHIVDYLASEVLATQPPEAREFLLQTSILERMCAELCDAVTGGSGAARRLEEMERSNLFTMALDNRGRWFRYHHLFADLLANALRAEQRELVPELHRRAAEWHAAHGEVGQAIQHAAAAGEERMAADLIAEHWFGMLNLGRHATVIRWLAALPDSTVEADARLCVAGAWSSLSLGRLDRVAQLTTRAGELLAAGDGDPDVEAGLALLQANMAGIGGDTGSAVALARRAVEVSPEGSPANALGHLTLGVGLAFSREGAQAAAELERGLAGLPPEGSEALRVNALGVLALTALDRGDGAAAERATARAEELIARVGASEEPWMIFSLAARARLLEQRDDLDGALDRHDLVVNVAHAIGWPFQMASGLIGRGRLRRLRGEHTLAAEDARRARAVLDTLADPAILTDQLERLERALGRGSAAPRDGGPAAAAVDLTDRELAVLRLLAGDLSLREIGGQMFVSLNTVKSHTRSIYRKLEADGRDEAVARGRALDLI